ncbi:MAG: hypothetical protein GXO08_04970 [Aquificae bacterium]|nr:hypothetical protein [Aquificota bacterium]
MSCTGGGGGGGGTVLTTVTEPVYQGTYQGAAAIGELAVFTVNGTELSYRVWGTVLGEVSGTLKLEPWMSGGGFFWKNDAEGVYLGVFKNVGVAYVDDYDITVVGLKEPSDPAQFDYTKTYALIKVYKDDAGNWHRELVFLSFDAANKTAKVEYQDGTVQNFSYQENATLKTVDLIDAATGEVVAHLMHKLTEKGTELITVDFVGGKGFAIGRETTEVTLDPNQQYKVYYYGESLTLPDDRWWGTAVVYNENGTWFAAWTGRYTWNGQVFPYLGKAVIHFNYMCQFNETTGEYELIQSPGLTCGCSYDEQTGQENRAACDYGIVDPENQFFLSMGENLEDGKYLEIGGW